MLLAAHLLDSYHLIFFSENTLCQRKREKRTGHVLPGVAESTPATGVHTLSTPRAVGAHETVGNVRVRDQRVRQHRSVALSVAKQ